MTAIVIRPPAPFYSPQNPRPTGASSSSGSRAHGGFPCQRAAQRPRPGSPRSTRSTLRRYAGIISFPPRVPISCAGSGGGRRRRPSIATGCEAGADCRGWHKEEAPMDYGVVMFPTEYAIAPDELARTLEDRGFESVWFPEHTHIPASRRSPWPGGGDLPRDYWSSYDPFIALMAAAGATKRLRLGTGICLVIERDPFTMAKEVATLDRLSGGRVLFGF